ncbi:MAG: hypothetical protein UZ09_BCD002002423 [Bacteroidetes bacterium OLB9]|nr:MAG: hypothetical protein UZ09_BCD002002423 [Bacteroidetes bacterium OLB9]
MKRFGFILLICSLYLCVTPCYGQKRQAKIFFDAQKYNLALKEFNKIKKINKKARFTDQKRILLSDDQSA